MRYYTSWHHSPLGRILLAATGTGLAGLWLEGQRYFPKISLTNTLELPAYSVLSDAASWLDDYFGGHKPSINQMRLEPQGSAFQLEVWQLLCRIPYGSTITYGELASRLPAGRSNRRYMARAVGGAVVRNPIAIIIPCHRVIGSDGSLTGYAGGLKNKVALLELEGISI